jgi:hypothetical protein
MRIILAISIMSIIMFSTYAHGQTPNELECRLVPNKILQNSDGMLQVYAKGDAVPTNIENLVATSSDSSIIQILGVEQDKNNFITDIKIKTGSAGTANIELAAPGFSSQEFPITVYNNDNMATKLLIKTTPSTFSTTGPKQGYVSIEFVNDANFPTRAISDTPITLSTSNSDVLTLNNNELIIKKGEYFTIGQFQIKKDGSAQISASSQSMQTVSSTVTVTTVGNQQTLQLFVYPTKINNYANSNAYAIVQLHDSSGNLVQATDDIPVSVQITDTSNTAIVNTSQQSPLMSSDESLVIKKGSYWGYSKLTVNSGTNDTFSLGISAKGYSVSQPISLTPIPGQLYDTKFAKTDLLPILATGQDELVGVLHLEDNNGNPVIASSKFLTEIDSSNPTSLSIDNVQMDQGSDAALVFGKVGTTIPNPVTLNVITQNTQTLNPTITLPTQKSNTLVAESLIPQIISNDDYPTAVYMLDSNNALTTFPKDLNAFITPNDYVQIESKLLSKDQSITLLNSKPLKEGTTTVSLIAGDYKSDIQINNLSSKPSSVFVDYPSSLVSNLGNTFSIQLLNSQQLPVFADHDMNLKLVSSDPLILNVPSSVTIKNGNYYSLFDVKTMNVGTTELSVLSNELPLAKYDISITSLTPEISISSNDHIDRNAVLNAAVTAQYHGAQLEDMKVDWHVKGAAIQKMDSVTNKDGVANISVLVQDPTTVDISASVSGGIYGSTTVDKSIGVNPPLDDTVSTTTGNTKSIPFNILGLNPLFVIIPVVAAAGGGILVLKKKNMLEGITEKISVMEKISEIKDRISQMREK